MASLITEKTIQFVQGVFFPNEPVCGFIKFHLREPAAISGITVNIVGERNIIKQNASSRGTESSNEENGTNSAGLAVRILKLVDVSDCIFSASPGHKMEAGTHSVPFSVKLPPNIPSSIESPKWTVHYKLIATVIRTSDKSENFERSFSVNRVCDLNKYPKVKMPVQMQYIGTKFLCINRNMVNVSANINRCGFMPGEQISISALIENNSSRSISHTKMSLIQKICHVDMFLDMKKLKCKRTVADSTRGSVPIGGTQIWRNELLTVPPIPSSSANDCFGWSVRYYLQMDIVSTAMNKLAILRMPIIIGNIPLMDLNPYLKISHPKGGKLEFFQVNKDYFSEEECVFSNKTGEDIAIQSTPKYLTLRLPSTEDFPQEGSCNQTQDGTRS